MHMLESRYLHEQHLADIVLALQISSLLLLLFLGQDGLLRTRLRLRDKLRLS
ncbi:hypothetical protein D3C81_1825730 [compost metagenome]